ncbi:MAG: NAD(P)-dependent oxidoreductase [Clostridiales bacterium]|nr:NAD(P)-dependent oxidoreductase [Clostridiales bacterium]
MISKIFREDIEQVLHDENIPWEKMTGTATLITGATGLIGSALVRVLAAANERYGLNMRVTGHGRNAAKGEALCRECGIEFIARDIRRPIPAETLSPIVDYIFHGAAVTHSADMVSKPVDVISTAYEGTLNALKLAVERRCRSFVYLSSMEVYGQTGTAEVKEQDLGYIDLASPRSSYSESKRLCENLCAAFYTQYFVPVKVARPAQTFGAGTPRDDTRVFAQFARSAINGQNLILRTKGTSKGNYCDIADTVRALLTILLKGEAGEAYNISNPRTSMTIRDMANLVANDVCGEKIKVETQIPGSKEQFGYAPDTGFTLNSDKLMSLGWKPRRNLSEVYRHLIADWQENKAETIL